MQKTFVNWRTKTLANSFCSLCKSSAIGRMCFLRKMNNCTCKCRYWYRDASIGWYRGVTVPVPGWVIWKYWNCPSKFFSLGIWLLSTPNGEEGYNSSTDLNPITNSYSSSASKLEAYIQPTNNKQTPSERLYVKSAPHQPQYCTYI